MVAVVNEDQALEQPPDDATPHLRADDVGYLDLRLPEEVFNIEIPLTGEIVPAADEAACIRALATVREIENDVKRAKAGLTDAIVYRSRVLGTKTLNLGDGRSGVVGSDTETVYDAESIEHELREAGMPEDRIRQIVREEITHTVVAAEAKKAAGANPVYAEIIERHKTTRPKTPYVSLKGFS